MVGALEEAMDTVAMYGATERDPASSKLPLTARLRKMHREWSEYKVQKSSSRIELDRPMDMYERARAGLMDEKRGSDELYGDALLNKIVRTMEMFGEPGSKERTEMRDDQRIMFSHCLCSLLPLIYGKKLESNRDRLLKQLSLDKIREQLVILASRRVGKTTFFAMLLAAIMISIPKVEVACFSLALRASQKVMKLVVQMLSTYTGDDRPRIVTHNQEKLILVGSEDWQEKIFHSFPDTTHVCCLHCFAKSHHHTTTTKTTHNAIERDDWKFWGIYTTPHHKNTIRKNKQAGEACGRGGGAAEDGARLPTGLYACGETL